MVEHGGWNACIPRMLTLALKAIFVLFLVAKPTCQASVLGKCFFSWDQASLSRIPSSQDQDQSPLPGHGEQRFLGVCVSSVWWLVRGERWGEGERMEGGRGKEGERRTNLCPYGNQRRPLSFSVLLFGDRVFLSEPGARLVASPSNPPVSVPQILGL